MLTVRAPGTGSPTPVAAFAGGVVRVGYEIPDTVTTSTAMRVLIVGDLLRRVLEDLHSTQVLAALITKSDTATMLDALMVRPVAGRFDSRSAAARGLGRRLDLVVTPAIPAVSQGVSEPLPVFVGPVQGEVSDTAADFATVRFVLAATSHATQADLAAAQLDRAESTLDRWRERLEQWSRHPSRPIPQAWQTAVTRALDDDLDVATVWSLLDDLENTPDVDAGAKFEAFAFIDRILAVDLVRDLGRHREQA